ncbi:MAG: DUF6077 domain-containing protein [Nocardioides sp.]
MTAGGEPGARLGAGLDALLDAVVVALAAWTVFYEAALAAHLTLWGPSLAWLVLTLVGTTAYVVRAVARPVAAVSEPPPASPEPRAASGRLLPAAWVVALAVAAGLVAAHELGHRVRLLPAVLALLVVLVLGIVLTWRRRVGAEALAEPVVGVGSHLVAVAASAGLALVGSLVAKGNDDDIYYVNRSVWVAEHGVAALRDTMFGPQTFPSTYGGGLPLSSVEALLGGLAHELHVAVGVVAYLVLVPVASFLAGLAVWRLVRAWAPRRAIAAFLVAEAFLLLSDASVQGNFFVTRIWQGKVIASCVVLPLAWAVLARLGERASRADLVRLLCLGTAFVGLSSTAAIQAPMVAGPALLAALLLRRRGLALGALALVAAPLVSGVVQVLGAGVGGPAAPGDTGPAYAWTLVLGREPAMVALALAGVGVGAMLPRRGRALPVLLAGVAALATLLPGVFRVFDDATGAGAVSWRLLLQLPVAVLVGLLVTVPLPRVLRGRVPALAVPVVVAALVGGALLVQGQPVWEKGGRSLWAWPPAWKDDPRGLADVRAVLADPTLRATTGPWLLPAHDMGTLATVTTRHFAVVPRAYYLQGLREPAADTRARRLLEAVEAGPAPLPPAAQVRAAIARLHVGVVCAPAGTPVRLRLLQEATGTAGLAVGRLVCHVPAG